MRCTSVLARKRGKRSRGITNGGGFTAAPAGQWSAAARAEVAPVPGDWDRAEALVRQEPKPLARCSAVATHTLLCASNQAHRLSGGSTHWQRSLARQRPRRAWLSTRGLLRGLRVVGLAWLYAPLFLPNRSSMA